MAVIAPWLQGPDVLGAIQGGARLGLSRQQMLQEAAQKAAELDLARSRLGQEGNEENANRAERHSTESAANALRTAALKQAGILGTQRNENAAALLGQRGEALDAREALDQARADDLSRHKPIFSNTGGGLMQFDEQSGKWNLVSGSSKPAKPENEGTVKVPIDGQNEANGTVDLPINSPIYQKWAALKPTVTPSPAVPAEAHTLLHPFSGTPAIPAGATSITNAPPSLGDFMKSGGGNSLLNVPAAPNPTPKRTFTDKSGTKFIYSGSMDDPTQDTNSASWQVAPEAPQADTP